MYYVAVGNFASTKAIDTERLICITGSKPPRYNKGEERGTRNCTASVKKITSDA